MNVQHIYVNQPCSPVGVSLQAKTTSPEEVGRATGELCTAMAGVRCAHEGAGLGHGGSEVRS